MMRVLLTFVVLAGIADAHRVEDKVGAKLTQEAKKALRVKASEDPAAAPAGGDGTVPAPEQGFEWKDVSHVDMETALGDWRREYGPKGPYHHPAAEPKKSACGAATLGAALLLLLNFNVN